VNFVVAIKALSLFILCLFFLGREKKRERKVMATKMHEVAFHPMSEEDHIFRIKNDKIFIFYLLFYKAYKHDKILKIIS